MNIIVGLFILHGYLNATKHITVYNMKPGKKKKKRMVKVNGFQNLNFVLVGEKLDTGLQRFYVTILDYSVNESVFDRTFRQSGERYKVVRDDQQNGRN